MKYNDLFYEIKNFGVLNDCEFKYHYNLFKNGDMNARNILIERNIRLVMLVIYNKFNSSDYEFEELFDVGIIGLIKAIDSFDIDMNKKISTYATKCIQNEILMYLRKNKRNINNFSLDMPVLNDGDTFLTFGELLEDDNINLEEETIKKELERVSVDLIFDILNEREKKIIKMYFGFIDDKIYNHEEIAKELNIHRATVTKMISGIFKKIKKEIINNRELFDIVNCLYFDNNDMLINMRKTLNK